MRVLVTRAEDDAKVIAERLRTLGHEAIVAPLLEIRFKDGGEIPLDGVQAIVATSANGVRAFARRSARRDLPLFAVGPQTAEEARNARFADVRSANGDATALAEAAAKWAQPSGGALLHVTGDNAEGRLAAMLKQRGFAVRTQTLYDVGNPDTLPRPVADALTKGTVDAALFFSPKSAAVFSALTADAGLMADAERLLAVAISEATAAALAPLRFREVRVAAAPNQDALLSCLG